MKYLLIFLVAVGTGSCRKPARAIASPVLKEIVFSKEVVAGPLDGDAKDKIELNGFEVLGTRFHRTDTEGSDWFMAGGTEFYCAHGALYLKDILLGDIASFKEVVSSGRATVTEDSGLWLNFAERNVRYFESDQLLMFPRDDGDIGGLITIVSKRDGEVLSINYVKPISDISAVGKWLASHVVQK